MKTICEDCKNYFFIKFKMESKREDLKSSDFGCLISNLDLKDHIVYACSHFNKDYYRLNNKEIEG